MACSGNHGEGEGEYTVADITKMTVVRITLHLREGEDEFLGNDWRVRSIISKYSTSPSRIATVEIEKREELAKP